MLFDAKNGTLTPADQHARIYMDGRDGVVDLVPLSKVKRRSIEQNKLYWRWIADIAAFEGYSSEYAHGYHKWHHGLAILAREHPEYRDTLMAMLRPLDYDTRIKAMQLVTCTSEFTTEQMTEYLDTIQRHWAKQGLVLENREDMR